MDTSITTLIASPNQLATREDLDLRALPRGPELDAQIGEQLASRGPRRRGTVQESTATQLALTWADLCERHPEYRGAFWEECRALYAGGDRLLGNMPVLRRLFPAHQYEDPEVYKQRIARAHYFAYPGAIIDSLLAGLSTDPLRVAFGERDEETGSITPGPGDEWWLGFAADVTNEAEGDDAREDDKQGGMPLHQFLVEAMRECSQTRHAWILVDLPEVPEDAAPPTSKLDQERSPGNAPYLCLIPAENVIDWHIDEGTHELEWALMLETSTPRTSLKDRRRLVRHTFTLWTRVDWTRYVVDVDPSKPPPADQVVRPSGHSTHGFGRVPLDRIELPEGLYAMGKLHSLAREHFNKRCAMAWAEYKALFSILYEFLADESETSVPVVGAPSDPGRATNQTRGQGYTQVRREKDRAEYVGPDPAVFTSARESCNDLMREMMRVMFSSNLSANMDSAALQRSGESKGRDTEATRVVLGAFGVLVRRVARVLLGLVSIARGEPVPENQITGLEKFDVAAVADAIAEAVQLFSAVPIDSPTFRALYLTKLYGKVLGDGVTDAQLDDIREEVETASTAEQILAEAQRDQAQTIAESDPLADPEDDEDDDEAPPKKKPAPAPAARKRMIATAGA